MTERRLKLRKFGLLLGGLIAVWTTVYVYSNGVFGVANTMLAFSPVLILWAVAWSAPELLNGIERLWVFLIEAINAVVTAILMGLVFYLVITPISLVRKLSGHDNMYNMDKQSSYVKSEELTRKDMEHPY